MAKTYRRRKVTDGSERMVAIGAIVSTKFLQRARSIIKPELLRQPYIKTVMGWCLEYYESFEQAPQIHIEDLFKAKSRDGHIGEDEEELISDLLTGLSDEYERAEQFNVEYLLKQTEDLFESRNLARLNEDIKLALTRGEVQAAQAILAGHKRVALPASKGVDPFTDREGMQAAFESAAEPLFKLPGAAGRYLNDMLTRDAFVVFLGPEKRGKTWLLIEASMWARRAGCNVAFFAAGDMTLPQMQVRYGVRFTGRSNKAKYCGKLLYPVLDCAKNQDDSCDMKYREGFFGVIKNQQTKELLPYEEVQDHKPCTYCLRSRHHYREYRGAAWQAERSSVSPLQWHEAIESGEKLAKRWGSKNKIKLSAYSKGTLTINGMVNQLDIWEDEDGFVPDVIIADYMDLIESDKEGYGEQVRHKIGNVWGAARRLSQDRHCLFLSATQADTDSYTAKWLGMKNFSESKIKNAHITGMIAMNQLPEEKASGIMRLSPLLTREDEFDEKKCVTILQSLAMGRPLLASF